MRTKQLGARVVFVWSVAFMLLGSSFGKFADEFKILWGHENVVTNDDLNEVDLILTPVMGAHITSQSSYLFGSFSVMLKLIAKDSAGTVCSFYLSSDGANHDEIDMEFLGNVTGQPYVLHTNIFVDGHGERENRMYLWFDPTADFHKYTILWNHKQIVWYVDDVPIRVYKNIEDVYPNSYINSRGQAVAASIFDGSSWATRGGRDPTSWESAPFTVFYKGFNFDACKIVDNINFCEENYARNWWETPEYQSLSAANEEKMKQILHQYRYYDYCSDSDRFPTPPPECAYNS